MKHMTTRSPHHFQGHCVLILVVIKFCSFQEQPVSMSKEKQNTSVISKPSYGEHMLTLPICWLLKACHGMMLSEQQIISGILKGIMLNLIKSAPLFISG